MPKRMMNFVHNIWDSFAIKQLMFIKTIMRYNNFLNIESGNAI